MCLCVAHVFGFEGGLDLTVGEALPVDASEEGMLPDVPLAFLPAAQTLGRVLGHQLVTGTTQEGQPVRDH